MPVSEGLGENYSLTQKRSELRDPGNYRSDKLLVVDVILVAFNILLLTIFGIFTNLYLFLRSYFAEPKSLKGRVCIVTGAGRGLGRELCLALAREGAIVACADINENNNETTATMLKERGSVAKAYTLNVALRKEVEDTMARVEKELGPIYLLVNNAAIVMMMYEPTEEYIRASFNVNVFGSMWTTEAVLPRMKARNEGHIVYISSSAAYGGMSCLPIYGTSKAALSHYAMTTRCQLYMANPGNRIQITTVHPTFVNTTQDYMDMFKFRINYCFEMREAVAAIMAAIRFNKEDVSFPGSLRPLLTIATLIFPSWLQCKLLSSLVTNISLPTREEFKNFPACDLVNSCSLIDGEHKKSS